MATARLIGLLLLLAAGATAAQMPNNPQHRLFETSDKCLACHNGLVTAAGEDISFGTDWATSMMANSARDPYWQAAVRRETLEHPQAAAAIEDECATCHMPMARYAAKTGGGKGRIFAHLPFTPGAAHRTLLAEDGVSCAMCHQIAARGLGTEESFTGGFHVDTGKPRGRTVYGPFQVDAGRQAIMQSASGFVPRPGEHIQASELCASCHTLYTHALGAGGESVGELPEQVPYLEWRHSAYRDRQSCQDCHMPVVREKTPVTAVLGQPRDQVSRHVFRGGNFFMQRILARYRDELQVKAPAPDLEAAARRTIEHLQGSAARVEIEDAALRDGVLEASVVVRNLAGHKLPTAYPSRRAWLHLRVEDAAGATLFESGRLTAKGAIAGNDNDLDPEAYEPHWNVIDDPGKVPVYEAIMATPEGAVTTGLLSAVRFIKDNRLLPDGFDKTTAGPDIAVKGGAADDGDFTAGADRVRYRVSVGQARGPLRVVAKLWYQPIAFRWAMNLAPFDTPETNRFVRYYRTMADQSGVVLTETDLLVSAPEGGG